MPALAFRYDKGGVYLPDLGLWLDAHEAQLGPDRVVISHAHADHVAIHREIIATRETAELMRARMTGTWTEQQLAYGEPRRFSGPNSDFTITLLPAGHICGSAMVLIEAGGSSLLYTGDFKLRRPRCAQPCQPRPADILIMETTYGLPRYRFPDQDEVLAGVVRFCRETLGNNETPVLFGYSLGKSQELMAALADVGLPLVLHPQVEKLTEVYARFGHSFPPWEPLKGADLTGKVILCPPQAAGSTSLRHIERKRTAVLTGWAVDPGCRFRYRADAAFPLSDHADFAELIEFVKQVNPKKVHTTHGFAPEFAQTLRELGYDAQALSQAEQLFLPLMPPSPLLESPEPVASAATEEAHAAEQARSGTLPQANDAFETFAMVCAAIGSTSKKLEKISLVSDYLKKLPQDALSPVATWMSGYPFAPGHQKVLQLGWAIIRDALCVVGQIDQAEFGRVYLKHSDLGETGFDILTRVSEPAGLTIPQIHERFQQLHTANGPRAKVNVLAQALQRCSALEGKYLIKILTGDLRIGLKEGLVEEAIANAFDVSLPEVKHANLLLGDIGATIRFASEKKLDSATLVPFRPIKYMLASPEQSAGEAWQRACDWPSAGEPRTTSSSAEPRAWLEDKYDGVRCQLHKVGNRVGLYSRDLKDITQTFPEIADAARLLTNDMVLDGEIVAMRDDEVLPFSELQRRLGRRESDLFLGTEIPVRFVAFDLLWLDGVMHLNTPLSNRRQRLEKLQLVSPFLLSQITQAESPDQIEEAFTAAKDRGNEGLMIKDPASFYLPGRRGLAWLKLKRAYATLDCVVIGAEFGHGKRKAVLSDYTFALRDEVTGSLQTIGKAFTGLTDVEIAQLTEHFRKRAIRQHGRYFEVPPEVVLEIAFDSIQASARHNSGMALRFPRIVRIRTDKTVDEIDTVATARRLIRATGRVKRMDA